MMLVYSGYVPCFDCGTAIAAFKNSKKGNLQSSGLDCIMNEYFLCFFKSLFLFFITVIFKEPFSVFKAFLFVKEQRKRETWPV